MSIASDVASEILLSLGHDPRSASPPAGASLAALRRCTREQLIEYARRLGLTGVAKLNKELLAARVQRALGHHPAESGNGGEGVATTAAPGVAPGVPADAPGPFPAKFDLGPDSHEKATPQDIPWSYGQNRVTAMVVDPEKMFIYWECTDAAIDTARRALGPAGRDAWLSLRIYDVTGRLFDGTNAHSYFDQRIERSDRQWFLLIGKPTSVACVELGLKSIEGFFAKISRSGRVEFPRREPVGPNNVEWLTVNTASGGTGPQVAGVPAAPQVGGAFGGGTASQRGLHGVPDQVNGNGAAAGMGAGAAAAGGPGGGHAFERRWEWRELVGGGVHHAWQGERSQVEWIGPVIRSVWEAGPFTYAVQSPAYVEEWNDGTMTVRSEHGQVHIVYGPWQVVIRGIGARAERRVLATWEIRRSWATSVGSASVEGGQTGWQPLAPGSSEWVAQGGSERSWLGGSELRLGGASELFLVGASELRLGGSSETLYTGASEWLTRGASERLLRGASEWLFAGASERVYAGASERLFAGASERLFAGASERLQSYPPTPGASENTQPPAYPEKR